jgi:hypothetical protein
MVDVVLPQAIHHLQYDLALKSAHHGFTRLW